MILNNTKFVKAADVKSGDIVRFLDEGEWQENKRYTYDDGNPRMDFVITVEINGDNKSMRLNATNRDAIIAAYGKDTAKWIGKSAIIDKMKALVAGKQLDVIMLKINETDKHEQIEVEEDIPF